jgi:hypothetical protein
MKTKTGPCSTMPALNLHFQNLAILGPLVLAADLLLFLGSEVVGDVEGLTDLLWGFALDHVGDSLASHIKEGLDVEVVGRLVAG